MLLIFSCNKWKEPTEVDFYVDIDKTPTVNNQLAFTGGEIIVEYFDFDADRDKGEDVIFSKEFSTGLIIPFNINQPVAELDFVIPQGIYKRIDISFKTFDDNSDNCILILGDYTYLDGSIIPFRFEFTDSEEFSIRAENDDGGEIVLDKDRLSPAKILLNPSHWFQVLSVNDFQNATLTTVDGVSTIVINKNENDNIYDLVINRLDESALIIFNY